MCDRRFINLRIVKFIHILNTDKQGQLVTVNSSSVAIVQSE